ncbi:3-dehydroquinate synthase [Chitinophagaceae bacterium MMS25-I14]
MQYSVTFPSGTVEYLFHSNWQQLLQQAPPDRTIIITDEHIKSLYPERFKAYRTLTVSPGEQHKSIDTISSLAHELIKLQAHRKTLLVGVGGGMVTDITGFLASVYMRGMPFGFVPTTLLGMVDAAVGGKNGVNMELHKNMLGTIRQPGFILYDTSFLSTLADEEWSNGFAEIIKYGCISDVRILTTLKDGDIKHFQKRPEKLYDLIIGCVDVKNKIVHADENENGMRKLLNFGHTAGHAFETLHQLPHGHSVALGMNVACILSESQFGMTPTESTQLQTIIQQYQLPVKLKFDIPRVMEILTMDKKRNTADIDYVLLHKLGKAGVKPLAFDTIKQALEKFADAGDY